MKVSYSSNNSGGRWWLKDEDWKALEAAGWEVEWYRDKKDWRGERYKNGRSLGALASEASFEAETPADAIRSFETITGQTASDEGCNCCGPPHSFSWGEGEKHGYASGDDICDVLYGGNDAQLSKRELIERLRNR